MEYGEKPGSVVELYLDSIKENKIDDFSIHQVPTSNLLRELRDFCGVEVIIVALQPPNIPSEVNPGLSQAAQCSVIKAADHILAILQDVK